MTKLLTHFNPKAEEISEEKLKELEEKFINVQQESVLKNLMKGRQTDFLSCIKREDFVSYESWKKTQDAPFENTNDSAKFREYAEIIFKRLTEETFEIVRRKSDDERSKYNDPARKKKHGI